MLALFSFFACIVFLKIPANAVNVDRWSVITSFWDAFFKGEYVYFAKSNVGNPPGPMPFYFILALPFYFLGELGFFSLSGIILFFILIRYSKAELHLQTKTLLLILSSLFILWEIICRSNIFLNGTLIVFALTFLLKINKSSNLKTGIIGGILIGLTSSTRNVLVLPYIIAFIYFLKSNQITLKQLTTIGFIAILVFATTFLPFVWNHLEDFKRMNPFMIQSSVLMPFKLTIIFVLTAIGAGFLCKSDSDIYFYSGLVLFLTIVGYFVYHFLLDGFTLTFFESYADISYFILSIPFSLFYLLVKEQNSN